MKRVRVEVKVVVEDLIPGRKVCEVAWVEELTASNTRVVTSTFQKAEATARAKVERSLEPHFRGD